MKKVNDLVANPFFVLFGYGLTLYYGLSYNIFHLQKNFGLHFFYQLILIWILGYYSAIVFFLKSLNDNYRNYVEYFQLNDFFGINQEQCDYLNFLYYYTDKNYYDTISFHLFIYIYIGFGIIYSFQSGLPNDFQSVLLHLYDMIFFSLIYLRAFDFSLKSEIRQKFGELAYNSYISKIYVFAFNNNKPSAIIFLISTLIMVFYFYLKSFF